MSQAHQTSTRRPPGVSTPIPATHDGKLIDTMDELLDELDEILEEEDEFLKRYRQHPGE